MGESKEGERMHCTDPALAELIPMFIKGELGQEEDFRVGGHISECQACQEYLRILLELQDVGLAALGYAR